MWKNLKGYFIVEEEANPKEGVIKGGKAKSEVTAAAPHPSTTAPASAPTDLSGVVSDRVVQVLMEALEKQNLPGFDYLEYKKSLQNLKSMNFTDDVRYKTAFAAAQSMGVTPQDLVNSAQHYLTVLAKEEGKFNESLQRQRNTKVGDNERKLKEYEEELKRKEVEIKKLQADIKKTQTEQERIRKSIQASTGKLTKAKADFDTTYGVIRESIEQDVKSVREYLMGK